MSKALETRAWNCNEWPRALSDQVEGCMEVSDEADMSTEQVVAYAILSERERCARIAERDHRSDLAVRHGYSPDWHKRSLAIAAAIRDPQV